MRNYTILKSFLITGLILALFGCSPIRKTIITEKVEVIQRDSTVIKDSIVYHHLYKELYKDYIGLLDTLNLETSYASAKAYVDTTNKLLKGQIENKDKDIPIEIKWKEHIIRRDSVVYKDIPVPVEVTKEVKKIPKSYYFSIIFNIILVFLIFGYIYIKFFRKRFWN